MSKSFRCNIYKKQGEGGQLLLTRNAEKDLRTRPSKQPANGSQQTSARVRLTNTLELERPLK